MRRQARLDAPGILHHVMVRGLERRRIFRDDVDRHDFCTRLEGFGYHALEVCGYTGTAVADLLGGASLGGLPGCATRSHRSGSVGEGAHSRRDGEEH